MITKLTTVEELKQIFSEALINRSGGKVTKVSDNSVFSGIGYGVGKVAQKTLKEIALSESFIFPNLAAGDALDLIAQKNGISERYGASGSSTYVRLVADVGTVYVQATHELTTDTGVVFQFVDSTITIDAKGFTYAKVQSTTQGSETNVGFGEIVRFVGAAPTGHLFVINEYAATGGRDIEQDEFFRNRIQQQINLLAKGTISALEQAFSLVNSNVLRVFNQGINNDGKLILAISTQNGVDLTQNELDEILTESEKFLSLTDLRPFGTDSFGVVLTNVTYFPIDVSFRVELDTSVDVDIIRSNIQSKFAKYIDYRFWVEGSTVQWDDLLQIVKETNGVKYVPDTNFTPSVDIAIPKEQLPRFRGFLMLDLQGNVITSDAGILNPTFYPFPADLNFTSTVLRSI